MDGHQRNIFDKFIEGGPMISDKKIFFKFSI